MKEKKKYKCPHCYNYVGENNEHYIVPIRDLSFLVLNLCMAFDVLKGHGHEFSQHEIDTMDELFKRYSAPIHWNSSGRFYDMPKKEHKNFKFRHKSYM